MGRRCSRCSEPATAAVKVAAAATVKQSAAAVRPGGLRGSERVGDRRIRTATAADGSALRAVEAGGWGWKPVGDGSAEAATATVSGTGHGTGRRGRHSYSSGPQWRGGGGVANFRQGGRVRKGRGGVGVGARGGYYKPSLTETLWGKGNRTVVVCASLRGDGKPPPFRWRP